MNKFRLEALSDGVFAIVMTLLIIEIHVPHLDHGAGGGELREKLWAMWPLFRSYYLSFLILGMYWISHHAMFHMYIKHVNRILVLLNILFLCFISLIPFSTHLIGEYPKNEVAIAVYGFNVILIGVVQWAMLVVGLRDKTVLHEDLSLRLIVQGAVRLSLTPIFAAFGIIAGFSHSNLSFFLFAFPVIFNIIPGTLNAVEHVFTKIFRRR